MDSQSFDQVKSDIHHLLLSQLDLERLSTLANGRARQAVTTLIQEIILKEKVLLNGAENGYKVACWTKSLGLDRSSRCSRTTPFPIFW